MNLVWTANALRDLANLREYIARNNPEAAKRVASAIHSYAERQLDEYPNSGRPGRVAGTLELVIPRLPFILPYRIKDDRIEVLRVYHAARSWPENF